MCARPRAVPPVCKEVAVAAIESRRIDWRVWARRVFGLMGGIVASSAAKAVDLPDERADMMLHLYDGGGVRASGPALLVRKNFADRVSVFGSYYVDMVSNASIDVVTTASPFKETRNEYGVGADYVVRDSLVSVSTSRSKEPDYLANSASVDVTQDTFGGMTTVTMGFTRGWDKVGKHDVSDYIDSATHWRYRLGVTQILTPRLIGSINTEAVADDGYLGSPYRAARVFGAFVPERYPRTRSSRAIEFRLVGDLGNHDAVHGSYRYFWDTWEIRAHTLEAGYSRHFGEQWLGDAYGRFYKQNAASFYSDNAVTELTYISRNRQLSDFNSYGVGAKLEYLAKSVPGKYTLKLNGAVEYLRFDYKNFTDLRSGSPYAFNAYIVQMFATLNY